MKFTKMHGIGNDYVFVDCFHERVANPAQLSRVISDRHFSVGSDGLILISPSRKADAKMRIFNADGSEAEMCGNGIRCVAKYVYERKLAKPGKAISMGDGTKYPASLKIETEAGVLTVGLAIRNKEVQKVCVNMGEPRFRPREIPVKLRGERVIEHPINILGQKMFMTCVSMGNPHAVFFCDDVKRVELEKIGPVIEKHRIFPNRTNVNFVQVDGRSELTMRTWERGSGVTLACGTGACACCVAAVLTARNDRVCTAHLPGGDLKLNWCKEDNCVYMAGPAAEVFEGVWAERV
jgi:diaminopimelate epimerase